MKPTKKSSLADYEKCAGERAVEYEENHALKRPMKISLRDAAALALPQLLTVVMNWPNCARYSTCLPIVLVVKFARCPQ
jgi:hypothetical protein